MEASSFGDSYVDVTRADAEARNTVEEPFATAWAIALAGSTLLLYGVLGFAIYVLFAFLL
jgi:preprotein translocase subunit Sss1